MVRPCRFADSQRHFVTGQGPAFGVEQFPDDRQSARIRERLHHRVQGYLGQIGVVIGFHDLERATI